MKKQSHHEHERELHLLKEELALTKTNLEIAVKQLRLEQQNNQLLREVNAELKQLLPHPTKVRIKFGGIMAGNPLTLNQGQTSTATVKILDQFGNEFQNFDFGANPPVWTSSNTASVGVAAGTSADTQQVSGVAPGTATLSVDVPGVTNGHDEETVTVTAPAPVPTSVKVVFSPPA